MTLQEFLDWLDRYGGNFADWPAALAAEAAELLAGSPKARAHHAAQQLMDEAFAETVEIPAAPAALAARIMARID